MLTLKPTSSSFINPEVKSDSKKEDGDGPLPRPFLGRRRSFSDSFNGVCIPPVKMPTSGENSPYTPKFYAENAMDILETRRNLSNNGSRDDLATAEVTSSIFSGFLKKTQDSEGIAFRKPLSKVCYEVKNTEEEICKIKHMVSIKGEVVHGEFSFIYEPVNAAPLVYPGIPNDRIVVKILKENHLNHAKKFIDLSVEQYFFLDSYFKEMGEGDPPIVRIYNAEDAAVQGYTVVEKVSPFSGAPWKAGSSLPDLSIEHRKYYESLVKLIKASDAAEEAGVSGLDLKWNNLGRNDRGSLALIDYANVPFSFAGISDSYAKRLAQGNQSIEEALSKKIV
ncbi:MAG: hypothetical protein V4489_09120 [Chlamydiota bacterium]